MSDSVTLYVLQYQLKRNLHPFTRQEIYTIADWTEWRICPVAKNWNRGKKRMPLRRGIHNLCAETVAAAPLKRTE